MADLSNTALEIARHALTLPEAEQHGYIVEKCQTDDELKLAALEAWEELRTDQTRPVGEATVIKAAPDRIISPVQSAGFSGIQIGPYQILDCIGEGGMGAVYLANQTDPIKRQVAVKIIKPGMNSRQVVARFKAEQQALAMMNHPNIAQVFDVGVTNTGLPYFVMEYIPGQRITHFCDEKQLTTDARLNLFRQVCAAIQHAHQKGVIHRDIKPSNVMVSEESGQTRVKVIDFGVAKALNVPLTDETFQTQIGQLIGTIHYMSPEQAASRHDIIDTRSDVYSLGVLLYELITGTRPFQLDAAKEGSHISQLQQLLFDTEPTKPSFHLSKKQGKRAEQLGRLQQTDSEQLYDYVKGELEWIILKAIEKEQSRRYQSPLELSQDLERFLSNEALLAGPPSKWYRARKFIARNRLEAGASLLVASTFLVAFILVVQGLIETRQAKDQAVIAKNAAIAEQQKSQQVIQLLGQFLTSVDPKVYGKELKVIHLLESFSHELKQVKDRDILTNLYQIYADTYANLGEYQKSKSFFDLALANIDADDRETYCTLQSRSYKNDLYLEKDGSELSIRNLLRSCKKSLGDHHPAVLSIRQVLALYFYFAGSFEQALQLNEELLNDRQRVLDDEHPDTLLTMTNLASSYAAVGRFQDAHELENKTLSARREKLGGEHPATLVSMSNFAVSFTELGRIEAALELNETVLKLQRKILGDDHPDTLRTMANLAGNYAGMGRNEDALALDRSVVEIHKKVLGEEHPDTLSYMSLLGYSFREVGKYEDARNLLETVVANSSRQLGEEHEITQGAKRELALTYTRLGRHNEAVELNESIVGANRKVFGERHPITLKAMAMLAFSFSTLGRFQEAKELDEAVFNARKKLLGERHPDTLWAQASLASSHKDLGQFKEAMGLAESVFSMRKQTQGQQHPDTLWAVGDLACLYAVSDVSKSLLPIETDRKDLNDYQYMAGCLALQKFPREDAVRTFDETLLKLDNTTKMLQLRNVIAVLESEEIPELVGKYSAAMVAQLASERLLDQPIGQRFLQSYVVHLQEQGDSAMAAQISSFITGD